MIKYQPKYYSDLNKVAKFNFWVKAQSKCMNEEEEREKNLIIPDA